MGSWNSGVPGVVGNSMLLRGARGASAPAADARLVAARATTSVFAIGEGMGPPFLAQSQPTTSLVATQSPPAAIAGP